MTVCFPNGRRGAHIVPNNRQSSSPQCERTLHNCLTSIDVPVKNAYSPSNIIADEWLSPQTPSPIQSYNTCVIRSESHLWFSAVVPTHPPRKWQHSLLCGPILLPVDRTSCYCPNFKLKSHMCMSSGTNSAYFLFQTPA